MPYATDIAGVPLLSPGEEITITRRLAPGTYGLLCFFPSPTGTPHVELGMKREFRVAGEPSTTLPTPDAVITATANGYSVPEMEAGTQTIELRNASGKEPSWYLSVPQPGATAEDFEAWVEGGQQGEAPVTFVGAMQSFPSGESIFVTLDLEAGTTYRLEDDPGGLPAVSSRRDSSKPACTLTTWTVPRECVTIHACPSSAAWHHSRRNGLCELSS